MSDTAWINNMRILTEAGCSEKGARLACDMLMNKESVVKENEELKLELQVKQNYIDNCGDLEKKVEELEDKKPYTKMIVKANEILNDARAGVTFCNDLDNDVVVTVYVERRSYE